MGGIASKIAGFIGLSPAKEGPLSGSGAPEIRGQHIAAGHREKGMLSGHGAVASAAQHLAGTAAIGSSGGGGGGGGAAGGAGGVTIQMQAGGGSGMDQLFTNTGLSRTVRVSAAIRTYLTAKSSSWGRVRMSQPTCANSIQRAKPCPRFAPENAVNIAGGDAELAGQRLPHFAIRLQPGAPRSREYPPQ